jgi:hypothetical protein
LVRRQAEAAVLPLIEVVCPMPDVVREIRANSGLSEAARQQALGIAERYTDDPALLNWASRGVAGRPGAESAAYTLALCQAEAACRLHPQEPANLTTLGMAQYRVGKYEDAVKTLTGAARLNEAIHGSTRPVDLAFLAMAQHQMGKKKEAQTALQRLREMMQDPQWAQQEEAQASLREAEALVGPETTGAGERTRNDLTRNRPNVAWEAPTLSSAGRGR